MKLPDKRSKVRKESVLPTKKQFSPHQNSNGVQNVTHVYVVPPIKIPREIWMTFTFTLVVGAFLFGGGIYLLYSGTVNSVTDFVVLGCCGSLVGLCFSSVGSVILLKSVCRSRRERCLTQVKSDTNGLLIAHTPDGQTKTATMKKKTSANHKQESVDNTEAGQNKISSMTKNFRISTKSNVYDDFPATTAASPVRDDASDTPLVQIYSVELPTNGSVYKSTENHNHCVILTQIETPTETIDDVLDCDSKIYIHKQPVSNISPLSILDSPCIDSWKTYQESLTIVVAEVHAEPVSSRSSLWNSSSFLPIRNQDFHESLFATSPIASDDEESAMCALDFITGDSASRPDTGVGESISEEDIPSVNDEPSFSYRMLTSDGESSDDDLMTTAMDDPLIFSPDNGAEHNYIFNKCHAITEVLVHSG